MSDNLTAASELLAEEMRSLVEQIDHLTARRQRIERALAYLSFEQAADPLLGDHVYVLVDPERAAELEAEQPITPSQAAKLARSVDVPPAPAKASTLPHPCPECGQTCGGPQGLAAHRRKAHGIAGKARSSTVDLDAVRALVEQAGDAA